MEYSLHLGDALDVLPTLEAGSLDAIITDLPYGTTQCAWDEVIPLQPMWEQVRRLLKPGGVFVTTASQPFTSKLVMSNPEWFRYEWVWDKLLPSGHLNAKRMPMRRHENVLVFAASSENYTPQMRKGEYREDKIRSFSECYGKQRPIDRATNLYYPTSILTFGNADQREKEHPTQKPVALYAYLIRTYTNPGDTVLDFCMGSGTTGVAAIKEGRKFVGVEREASYHAIAARRLADAAAQPLLIPVES